MLIGIHGKKRSGKDLFASILKQVIQSYIHTYAHARHNDVLCPIVLTKFAEPLKRMADIFLGEGFTKQWENSGEDFRNAPLGPEWGALTGRVFLQRLGTEAIRNNLHVNAWINACFANYNPELDNWIFTDMRFPNEKEAIESRGGITIKIIRPSIAEAQALDQHPSETALDDDNNWNYVVKNEATIDDLRIAARRVMSTVIAMNILHFTEKPIKLL